jgi:glycosyltransferase involved in cell wall biosynthesis
LLADEPARESLGRAARVIAEERYSWDRIARRLSEIYEALADSRSAVAA